MTFKIYMFQYQNKIINLRCFGDSVSNHNHPQPMDCDWDVVITLW